MFKRFVFKVWPFLVICVVLVILFNQFFFQGLIPMPADIIVGVYFPWLDYHWGYIVGVPVKNPLMSDIPSLIYPWRMSVLNQLQSGQLPLWNPFSFAGMPLLANFQSAVFSYVNMFFLFFPRIIAWSLGVIIQPGITILAIYLFLRNRNLSKISSILGGIVFSLSGFSTAWLEYNLLGHTAYFLPILLLILDRYLITKNKLYLLIWSAGITLQIFTGYLPIVIYTYLVLSLFILYFYHNQVKDILKLGIFGGLGLLLTAIQLLPGIELLKFSIRGVDSLVKGSQAGFLPLSHFVTILVPDFFGNPVTGNWWGKAFYDNFYFYVGTATLVLVIVGTLSLRKNSFVRFWVSLLILSIIMATKNPLGEFLQSILGLEGGVAARALMVTDFSLAILAAVGMERILIEKQKLLPRLIISILLISIGFIYLFDMSLFIENPAYKSIAQRNMLIPLMIFVFSIPFYVMAVYSKNKKMILISILMVLIIITSNLLYSALKYLPFSKVDQVFPTTPVIEFLQKQPKPFRVEFGETIPQNMWMPYGLESAAGYDAMVPLRYSQFLGVLHTGGLNTGYSRVAQIENYDSKLFDLLNIKYVLAVKYDKNGIRIPDGKPKSIFKNPKFKLVFENKTVQIYENMNVLPRAYLAHEVIVENSNQGIISQLLDPKFDLTKSVVLEEKIDLIKTGFDLKKDQVTYLNYGQNSSTIETSSEEDGILFVADSFYPGWEAKIDGNTVKIYRADFAFRGVFVPKGEHIVEFVYNPLSFRLGSFISLSVGIIMTGVTVVFFFIKIAPEILVKFIKK